MEQKTKRNSGLESLSIIGIICIILSHYSIHGGYKEFTVEMLSGEVFFLQVLSMFGRASCSIFAIISGYFMIQSSTNGYKKCVCLALQMIFYSWVILAIVLITGITPVSLKSFAKAIFPIIWGNWYAVYYIILLIFFPFINIFLKSLDKKTYIKLLTLVFFIWSVVQTITVRAITFSNFDFFVVMYMVGAYIRLYCEDMNYPNVVNLYAVIVFASLLIVSVLLMDLVGVITGIDKFIDSSGYFREFFTPIGVGFSISMFLYFKNKIFYSKLVNKISLSTLGIYLIHDNELARKVIWQVIFPNEKFLNTPLIAVHAAVKCLVVFIVCLIIDQIRLHTIHKVTKKLIDKKYPDWVNKLQTLEKKFLCMSIKN